MKSFQILLTCVAVLLSGQTSSFDNQAVEYARRVIEGQKNVPPSAGYVPDSDTAIAIATAVLVPIYGKAIVVSEKPWHTGLRDGVWTVVGTFHGKGNGGEAIVQIDKRTGGIIFVTHTM